MMDFELIARDIIYTDKYQSLKSENHHGLSRYEHSLRVARNTYKISNNKMKRNSIHFRAGDLRSGTGRRRHQAPWRNVSETCGAS